jgi:uncharacterized lipoprotein YbaY
VPTVGAVTGTLSYNEPARLSPSASAIVVLVEHSGDPITAQIVQSDLMSNPGQVPISYSLAYDPQAIDPEATYTVSATIVDGSHIWLTDNGTRVITFGNPTTGVDLDLVLQSDLLKGQVTGNITGTGITLGGSGFAATVLIDRTSNENVGISVTPSPTGLPIPFSVPFDPGDITDTSEYVVVAGIVEQDNRWANLDGVPVITEGNPLTDVDVPLTAVEPAPAAPTDSGISPLLLIVLLLLIAGGIAAAVWYYRSRQAPPPDDGTPPDGTPPDGAPPDGIPPVEAPPDASEAPPGADVAAEPEAAPGPNVAAEPEAAPGADVAAEPEAAPGPDVAAEPEAAPGPDVAAEPGAPPGPDVAAEPEAPPGPAAGDARPPDSAA